MITDKNELEARGEVRRAILDTIYAREELNSLLDVLYTAFNSENEIGVRFKLNKAVTNAVSAYEFHNSMVKSRMDKVRHSIKRLKSMCKRRWFCV